MKRRKAAQKPAGILLSTSDPQSGSRDQYQHPDDTLHYGPFHSKVCRQLLPGSVPFVVRDGLLCSFVTAFGGGILLRVQKSAIRAFSSRGSGSIAPLNDPMQLLCQPHETEPNTNMQGRCFSCVAGWHVDERYCNGGWYILGCCPSVCCFLSTHQVLVLAFCSDSVQRRHHRFFALWVIAGLTTFMSPLFTPNSTTAPSEQIYTELAQDGRPRRRRIRLPVQGRPHR